MFVKLAVGEEKEEKEKRKERERRRERERRGMEGMRGGNERGRKGRWGGEGGRGGREERGREVRRVQGRGMEGRREGEEKRRGEERKGGEGEGRGEKGTPPLFSLYEISAIKELLMISETNLAMCLLSSAVPLTMPHCVLLHGSVWSVSVGHCMDRWRGTPQKSVLHAFYSHTSSLGMRLYSSSNYILSFILGGYNQNHDL